MWLKPVTSAGDLKHEFLLVRTQPEDRDALRFHWIKETKTSNVEILRLTCALFGLVQSLFLLGGTLHQHLEGMKERCPRAVEEIKKSLYVDDVITGGETTEKVRKLKESTVTESTVWLTKVAFKSALKASGEPEGATPRINLESNPEKPRRWGYHGTKPKTPSLSHSERPPQKYLRDKCCGLLLQFMILLV